MLLRLTVSPAKLAVMEWVTPPFSVDVVNTATPLEFNAPVPREVDPSKKVIGPVGDPVAPDNVAVKVTASEATDGFRLDCKATEVPFFTV